MDQMIAKSEALHTAMPLEVTVLKQLVAAKKQCENTAHTDVNM